VEPAQKLLTSEGKLAEFNEEGQFHSVRYLVRDVDVEVYADAHPKAKKFSPWTSENADDKEGEGRF